MSHLCPARVREWRQCRCPRPDDQKSIESPSRGHDELTVDDVLGGLASVLDVRGKRGVNRGKCTIVRRQVDIAVLVGTSKPEFTGTLRHSLEWAKRRGLLG